MRGIIKGISGHHIWIESKSPVTFAINTEVDIDIKEHKKKRSLNANSYYWELLGQLSRKLNISSARIHNMYLRQFFPHNVYYDARGSINLILKTDTDQTENIILEDRMHHYMPCPVSYLPSNLPKHIDIADGVRGIWYIELYGSSQFNSSEMAQLIDLLITDCKEQNIETMTPYELERLKGYERS